MTLFWINKAVIFQVQSLSNNYKLHKFLIRVLKLSPSVVIKMLQHHSCDGGGRHYNLS